MNFSFVRLLPYTLALVLAIGAFFFGFKQGERKQKVIIQERVIKAGERHAYIEQKQGDIIRSRSSYDIDKRLQSRSF